MRALVIVSYRDFGYSFRSVHQARNICSAASPPSGRAALAGSGDVSGSRGGSRCGSTRRPCPQAHRSSARGGGRTGRGSSLARLAAGRIFPSTLAYSTALLTSETATRVGIAPQASCTSASSRHSRSWPPATSAWLPSEPLTWTSCRACCTRSACWRSRARTTRPRSPPGCPPARRRPSRSARWRCPARPVRSSAPRRDRRRRRATTARSSFSPWPAMPTANRPDLGRKRARPPSRPPRSWPAS